MRLWVLGSGSRGNAVVVESGECRLLIDAGFGPRVLQKRMQSAGITPESIEACIITHEHSDHLRGAMRAARRWKWALFATHGTITHSRLGQQPFVAFMGAPVTAFQAGATLSFSALDVTTFRTPHDAAEPIGLIVTARSTGARAAVCTDIGYASRNVRQIVRDVDIMVLESNHDEHMLWNGPYPPWLQRRIAGDAGHLSNRACADLVRESVTPQLRQIVLAHLSEKNNTPMVAYQNMRDTLRRTAFRGALIPALQDAVVGPFIPVGIRVQEQLTLAL
jgi:phosphoribosyl 1,2-cyclic phosphodiesterase